MRKIHLVLSHHSPSCAQQGDKYCVWHTPINVYRLECLLFSAANSFGSSFTAWSVFSRHGWGSLNPSATKIMPINSKPFWVILFVLWMSGSSKDNIHPCCAFHPDGSKFSRGENALIHSSHVITEWLGEHENRVGCVLRHITATIKHQMREEGCCRKFYPKFV